LKDGAKNRARPSFGDFAGEFDDVEKRLAILASGDEKADHRPIMKAVLSIPFEMLTRLSRRPFSPYTGWRIWATVVRFSGPTIRPVWSIKPSNCIYTEVRSTMLSAGQRSTFEQLALPLLPSLYNHAFWLTRNHAEAEDLAQETVSKALRAFNSFQAGTNFKAWIFRILRNAYLTSRTGIAASRTVFLEDHPEMFDMAAATPTPEDTLIQLNNETALYGALDQLQPPLREILLLCDVEELKYKEIALVLDLPIGTVMSRISRARVALRQLLQLQVGEST
jgi:RNA polymerase sigma factor (sigma-70 family)